jgi:hypothetical protein
VDWPQSTDSRWSCRTFLALLNNSNTRRQPALQREWRGVLGEHCGPHLSSQRERVVKACSTHRSSARGRAIGCRRRRQQAVRGRISAGLCAVLGVATPSLHWHAVRFAAESTPRYRRVAVGHVTQNVWAALSWKTSFRMSQLMHSS